MESRGSTEKEKIGGVTLHYTWYPGEDLYSDGDVEDELLQIAKDYGKEDYDQVIAQKKSWPVLYHFSRIRQNIISWLPLTREDTVLEIGAGCGALTGALAERAKSVTCVELSRKRSLINAYRNREMENVEIQVGNYQDIEKELGLFDLITLIGVFEYAKGYIGGNDPYVDMLRQAASHLRPGGQIALAIENRIGLKYWSGSSEDHVGTYYEGLEGYPAAQHVRTFSRPALCAIIEQAGGLTADFYYPFPDYKLPMVIYSDDYLPKPGEIGENFPNYDRERILAFSEGRTLDTLIQDGLFTQFANSFLVILKKEGQS